jgi:hypothetical protein
MASGVALAVAPAGIRVLSASPRPVPKTPPAPSWVPPLTGLADPLYVAAARLDDAIEVPVLGPRGPRVQVQI